MKTSHPDTLDREIVQIMENDCSISYREIAERLGKDLWSVRDRVVLLKRRGIIQGCKAKIDYTELGFGCRSMMWFNVPGVNIDSFISFVKSDPTFKRLTITTGERRFILEGIGRSCNEIREYFRSELSKFGIYDVIFEVVLDSPV